jgi:hypothetical protein
VNNVSCTATQVVGGVEVNKSNLHFKYGNCNSSSNGCQ